VRQGAGVATRSCRPGGLGSLDPVMREHCSTPAGPPLLHRAGVLAAARTERRATRLIAALFALLPPAGVAAGTLDLSRPGKPAQCATIEVEADGMECDASSCTLAGGVRLACAGMRLWADRVDIALGPEHSFAGAQAEGHVLMVEGDTVLTCTRLCSARTGSRAESRPPPSASRSPPHA